MSLKDSAFDFFSSLKSHSALFEKNNYVLHDSPSGCNSFFLSPNANEGLHFKGLTFGTTVNTDVACRLWSWCFHLLSCVLLWVCGGLFTGVRHDSSRMWWESVWNRKHSGSFCSLISPSFDFKWNPSEWRSVHG